MGWLYSILDRASDLHKQILTECGDRVVDHRTTCFGRRLWVVYRSTSQSHPDRKLIIEFMCNSYKRDGLTWWGYKDVDETMGPIDVDCPLSLLDQCDEPLNEWATDWRARVRLYHERKKEGKSAVAGLKSGDRFELYGQEYTLTGKRGRSLLACHGWTNYRVGPKHFEHIRPI